MAEELAPVSRPYVAGELDVLRLGRVPYRAAHALQQRLVERRVEDGICDTLILCEHDAVVTYGRGSAAPHIASQALEVIEVERGGEATFHGPGQLVAYPILKLPEGRRDLHRLLRDLEQVVIDCLAEVDLLGERREGLTGVWLGGRKVCSIGVAVRRWVTWHGLALNLKADLAAFEGFRPCGLDPSVMANVCDFRGGEAPTLLFEVLLVTHLCRHFGLELPPVPPAPPPDPLSLPILG